MLGGKQPLENGYMYSVYMHGCAVLLCLVCLFDLACFLLPSFSSLIKTCIHVLNVTQHVQCTICTTDLYGYMYMYIVTHVVHTVP